MPGYTVLYIPVVATGIHACNLAAETLVRWAGPGPHGWQQIYAGVSLSDQQTTTDGTCGRFEVSLMETDNTAQTQSAPTSHLPVHYAYRTCGTTTTTTVDSSSQRQSFGADG